MKRFFRSQLVQLKIVVRIKSGEEVWSALGSRSGKVSADQSVPIGGMEGKLIRIDEETHHDSEKQYDTHQKHHDEELSSPVVWLLRQTLRTAQQ